MKANAREREPQFQAQWQADHLYQQLLDARDFNNRFLLHDGPPYLSSNKIHIGTALNKVLKDIVIRYKWQRGYYTPYVPGYDGHGLPIENAILQANKDAAKLTPVELRKACRHFAHDNLKGQEQHFRRLGILGNWEKPYVTVDGDFEAVQLKLFWDLYQKGYVYKALKAVYWDPIFETALAEAEIEYQDVDSESIYVKFLLNPDSVSKLPAPLNTRTDVGLMIWTTTPWTMPGNMGLCVNAELDYVFVETQHFGVIGVAQDLLETVQKACELGEVTPLATVKGASLERLVGIHPMYGRDSLVICGDHVTTEAGTGVVHTAPGHGVEDYLVGVKYGLEILCPVDNKGHLMPEAGERFAGLSTYKANLPIIEYLRELGVLVGQQTIRHSYPHSWRSHKPIIFRATPQWFINIDKVRQNALDAIDTVQWLPERGKNRISSMVAGRGDWCISRQRSWGVPIPVFYCTECETPHLTQSIMDNVCQLVAAENTDVWFEKSEAELMGSPQTCSNCQNTNFKKETDIMDVWIDSGVTHTAVVDARKDELGPLPAELYLEGSDQHRGWFQSSLLTSVMANGKAPYKAVLTHGFVVDETGRKMSKSLGNVVAPEKIIDQYGADVLRLWVASVDFTNDVRIGPNFLTQLAEVYKKVRNTIRFVLGNLNGFNPKTDAVSPEQFSLLDQYILGKLNNLVETLTTSFDQYSFHSYYQSLQTMCVNDLSALYFDVAKDILYVCHPNDVERRAVQTVLYRILEVFLPLLVPVMPHMAEDIWQSLPEEQKPNFGYDAPPKSVLLAPWPTLSNITAPANFEQLLKIRQEVNGAIEQLRGAGDIGSSLETTVVLKFKNEETKQQLVGNVSNLVLERLFIVSSVELVVDPSALINYTIKVEKANGEKCGRCWKRVETVGTFEDHPTICHRCRDVVVQLA